MPWLCVAKSSAAMVSNMQDKQALEDEFQLPATFQSGIILCVHLANERRRYIVRSSLIGCAHTENDPCSAWRDDRKGKYIFFCFLTLIQHCKGLNFGNK